QCDINASMNLDAHIKALAERYNAKTPTSKKIAQANRSSMSSKAGNMDFRPATKEMIYPLILRRAQGSRVWDADGNEYIDNLMGFGVHLFGHKPPFVQEALAAQLERGVAIGGEWEDAGKVCQLLCEITGHERSFIGNTGTEVLFTALRVVRSA